jgi:transcriptional regulator with XRE-family HTH domain
MLRKRHGFTLQELADQLATTNGYLSMVETGQREPRAAFVFRLARFFNVSTDALLDDDVNLEDLYPMPDSPTASNAA